MQGAAEHVAGTGRSRETLALCPRGCPQDAARPARASRHLAPRCVRCDVRPPAQPPRGPISPWGRSDSKRGGAQGGSRGRHTAPGRVRPHGRRAGGAQRGPRAGDELALAGRQLCPGQPRAERLADPGPCRQLRPHAGPWTARTGCPGQGGVAQRGTGTFLGREGTFLTCWSHTRERPNTAKVPSGRHPACDASSSVKEGAAGWPRRGGNMLSTGGALVRRGPRNGTASEGSGLPRLGCALR